MYTCRGSTYIEILICLLLIECMVVGVDVVQVQALRSVTNANYFSAATQQLKNIVEQLSLKPSSAIIDEWNKQNSKVLPAGFGVVQNFPEYKIISLYWGGANTENCWENKLGECKCAQIRMPSQ